MPHGNALTRLAESAVAAGAPTSFDKDSRPFSPYLNSPSRRLFLDFTDRCSAAELDQVVDGWDANASVNQCCKIPHVAEACTGVQGFGPTVSVLDLIDKNETATRLHQGPRQYTRTVTSATALRLLNIPKDMHRQLGLGDMYPPKGAGRRSNVCTVHMATSAIRAAVVMLRTSSRTQHHRRFSTGWREFCALVGVEIGDVIMFERTGTSNELAVRVVKAGTSQTRRGRSCEMGTSVAGDRARNTFELAP